MSWLRRRLQLPLYRNGYALIASSVVTSGLGLVYWLVAARVYSTEAVGLSAALISAMTTLANVCQLNLKSALNRFLPRAGAASSRFVARCYAIAIGVAIVAGAAFVAGSGTWTPKLSFVTDRPLVALWFVVATAAWTIFVLQDSALTGVRQGGWVLAENGAYSVVKIVLLVAFAGLAPTLGAFVAWTAPIVVFVFAVNAMLFRRLIPAHRRATAATPPEPVRARGIVRYVAADYVAYLLTVATIGVLPLAVLGVLGAKANAYWFVSWSIAYGLYLVAGSLGTAMITEASLDPDGLEAHNRRTISETLVLMVPAVAIVVAAAPLILRLLGDGYEQHAVTVLRLLALSALPWTVFVAYTNTARVKREMRSVVIATAALCAIVLGVGLPLLRPLGITALGIAWLAGQSAVALGILVPRLRLRGGRLRSINDISIAAVRWPADGGPAVLKRARTGAAEPGMRRQEETLATLRALPEVAALAPEVLASGYEGGRRYLVESLMPGSSPRRLLRHETGQERFLAATGKAIRPLHAATRTERLVDEPLLCQWVDAPLQRLLPVARRRSGLRDADGALRRLGAELRQGLLGRTVATSRIHGDLCPDNVLMSADGSSVQAIVDWEQSREPALPEVDLYHLLLTTRTKVERRELGDVVAGVVRDPGLSPKVRTYTLMAWLHHMAGNVEKSERYRHSRTWIRRNLDPVLAVVGGETAAPAAPVDARIALVAPFAALGLALLLWVVSLPQMDPSAMTDLGLISVMPTTFIIALGLLVGSFVTLVHRQPERRVALTAHLVTLIAFLHATPSILYGTLRYSWAWKHVGIVDYIQRHGTVTPSIHWLPVYHNWPGFFGLDALLTELAGLHSTLDMAIWGPPFFNLLDLGALLFLFTALTRDRRVIWLGCFFFLIANWVGQDYFSPQAFAFFLYLVTLGVIARWVGRRNRLRTPAVGLVVLLLVAIASAHALTSVMAVIAVGAAVVVRRSGVRWLPLAAGAITVVWDRVFAWDYVHANASGTFAQIRLPWSTTESSLTAVGKLSADQAFVAHVARGLVVGMVALAAVGAARQWQAGRLDRFAAALAAAPVLLFASGNYDGEILFRIYLFSVPFLAFLAASLFAAHGRSWAPALTGGVAALVLTAFVVAYYGKEHSNYFTPAEVSATNYLYTHAPAGSLLVEGTHNYPAQWKNYERFSYVTIANEPAGNVRRLLADPAGVLASWMAPHRSSFVILTRSQEIDVDANGAMPRGSVDRIQSALAASPRFRVVRRNADATIFALRRGGTR